MSGGPRHEARPLVDRPPQPTRLGTSGVAVNRAEVLAKALAPLLHGYYSHATAIAKWGSDWDHDAQRIAAALDAALAAQEGERGGVEVAANEVCEHHTCAHDYDALLAGLRDTACGGCGRLRAIRQQIEAAGRAEVAALEVLCTEVEDRFREGRMSRPHVPISHVRAALADPAGALATHDAEVLRAAADDPTLGNPRFRSWLRERADRIEAQS